MKISPKYGREVAVYCLVGAALLYFLMSVDALEWFYNYSRSHEEYELDEIILSIPVVLVLISIFSFRRLQELRRTTRSLKEAQVKNAAAQEKIEVLSRVRERFIAIACHELKSPIITILNSLKLIEISDSSDEMASYAALAREAAEGLNIYASDILEVTRLLAGDESAPAVPFDPCSLMEESVSMFRTKAEQKGIGFSLECDDDLPNTMVGHPNVVRHIVQNLTDNAVKYTESGRVRVQCGLYGSDDKLMVRIVDTGPGIPDDMRQSVFEPYLQVQTQQHVRHGVGLGLSIVKQLIDTVQGSIVINDNDDEGITFSVVVPVQSA